MSRIFYTTSAGLRDRRHLAAVLDGTIAKCPATPVADSASEAAVIGWGHKQNTSGARAWAAQHGLPFLTLEDGFIRSVGLGVSGAEPFGFVLDRRGVYYDASAPSELEDLIRDAAPAPPQAGELRRRLVELRVSKYNHCWEPPQLPAATRRRILLVDQTRGDLSVQLGNGDAAAFARMLAAARDSAQTSAAEVVVKLHPDVIAGKRRGYLAELDLSGCTVLGGNCNPLELALAVDEVFTVTSQFGFEALLAGRPVRCFGMPFYAGWGLTSDELTCPRRGVPRTIDQLFWAAYGSYTRYADPVSGRRCDLATIIDRIADHRRVAAESGGRAWVLGFSLRKRLQLGVWLPTQQLRFVRSARQALRAGAVRGDAVLTWGFRQDDEAGSLARSLATTVSRMEDGFIRSVGLGSDLVKPRSLVFDRSGIYFDPQVPSDLETLLATHPFTTAERERGARLAALLLGKRVTKYNTGALTPLTLPTQALGRRIALVPGQVEDDQSIRRGGVDIRTNHALLRAARQADPDAFLIYKPHPDVVAGNRAAGDEPGDGLADLVVVDQDMATCLAAVDTVHTMTSLTGFEALVHGRTVYAYGIPFYAGWGLTVDRHTSPRRGRTLSLAELVYTTLVLYPRYLDPRSGLFVGPEDIIELIAAQRFSNPSSSPATTSRWRHWLRQILNF